MRATLTALTLLLAAAANAGTIEYEWQATTQGAGWIDGDAVTVDWTIDYFQDKVGLTLREFTGTAAGMTWELHDHFGHGKPFRIGRYMHPYFESDDGRIWGAGDHTTAGVGHWDYSYRPNHGYNVMDWMPRSRVQYREILDKGDDQLYAGDDVYGEDVVYLPTFTATRPGYVIPEPATFALLMLGSTVLLATRFRN